MIKNGGAEVPPEEDELLDEDDPLDDDDPLEEDELLDDDDPLDDDKPLDDDEEEDEPPSEEEPPPQPARNNAKVKDSALAWKAGVMLRSAESRIGMDDIGSVAQAAVSSGYDKNVSDFAVRSLTDV